MIGGIQKQKGEPIFMEEIIKRIIQIEEEAAEIEKTVEEKMKQKKAEQEHTLERLQKVLKEKAASKVNTLREWEMKTADEEIRRQQEVFLQQLDRFTRLETEKTEDWVSDLFTQIIKE